MTQRENSVIKIISLKLFLALTSPASKILTPVIVEIWGGVGGVTCFLASLAPIRESGEKSFFYNFCR